VLVVRSDARKVDEKVLRMAASWVLWWVELTVRRWVGRLVACSELLRAVPRAAMKAGKWVGEKVGEVAAQGVAVMAAGCILLTVGARAGMWAALMGEKVVGEMAVRMAG